TGPGHADGYTVVTSTQALAIMRAEGTPAGGAPRPPTPLRITRVWFGQSSFSTDRGTRVLPAWMFAFAGLQTLPRSWLSYRLQSSGRLRNRSVRHPSVPGSVLTDAPPRSRSSERLSDKGHAPPTTRST